MAQGLPLPNLLNLIFHGPWGFVARSGQIIAATPIIEGCVAHKYLLRSASFEWTMQQGSYAFVGADQLAGTAKSDPRKGLFQQTVIANTANTNFEVPNLATPDLFCLFDLPSTNFVGMRRVNRDTPVDNSDNVLYGTNYRALNPTYANIQTSLALVQVLQYQVANFAGLGLQCNGGNVWTPAPAPGHLSVNLHIFAQAAKYAPGHDHFARMTRLFKFDLRMSLPGVVNETVEDDTYFPTGVVADDVKDLGAIGAADYPPTCGGSLIICDGGCQP